MTIGREGGMDQLWPASLTIMQASQYSGVPGSGPVDVGLGVGAGRR